VLAAIGKSLWLRVRGKWYRRCTGLPVRRTAAWAWLRKHDERVYSYVDATSFRVMRDRRLREALAFDQDFAAAGFAEVRA